MGTDLHITAWRKSTIKLLRSLTTYIHVLDSTMRGCSGCTVYTFIIIEHRFEEGHQNDTFGIAIVR